MTPNCRDPMFHAIVELLDSCDDSTSDHVCWVDEDGAVHIERCGDRSGDSIAQGHTRLKFWLETFRRGRGLVGPEAATNKDIVHELIDYLRDRWLADGRGFFAYPPGETRREIERAELDDHRGPTMIEREKVQKVIELARARRRADRAEDAVPRTQAQRVADYVERMKQGPTELYRYLDALTEDEARSLEVLMYSGREGESYEHTEKHLRRSSREDTISGVHGKSPLAEYLERGLALLDNPPVDAGAGEDFDPDEDGDDADDAFEDELDDQEVAVDPIARARQWIEAQPLTCQVCGEPLTALSEVWLSWNSDAEGVPRLLWATHTGEATDGRCAVNGLRPTPYFDNYATDILRRDDDFLATVRGDGASMEVLRAVAALPMEPPGPINLRGFDLSKAPTPRSLDTVVTLANQATRIATREPDRLDSVLWRLIDAAGVALWLNGEQSHVTGLGFKLEDVAERDENGSPKGERDE